MSIIIGKPLDRVDGRLKVTGKAKYSAEFPIKNLAYGVLVQSTIAKGRIHSIDTKAAEAYPGVLAVFNYKKKINLHQLRRGSHNPGTGKIGEKKLFPSQNST